MSQPSGFYKKRNAQGEMTTRPIIPSGGEVYQEPTVENGGMQVQTIKHREDPLKVALQLAVKGGQKADESISNRVKQYKETHTPEAILAKEEAKIQLLEAQETMAEERANLEIHKMELKQHKENIQQEAEKKALEEGKNL